MDFELIRPQWPAPAGVQAVSTTRVGGVSRGPWGNFNLADHVGDVPGDVYENRRRLIDAAGLPSEPRWLTQVHGCDVLEGAWRPGFAADASVSHQRGEVCVVMSADCLPILCCDLSGTAVAAVHAGWRGLAAGVIERLLHEFSADPADIIAWMGPAIGPGAFEVGADVLHVFTDRDEGASLNFTPVRKQRWLADLYGLARRRLAAAGVSHVYGGDCCTYSESERFFSYRRDGVTGRMATLIWRE